MGGIGWKVDIADCRSEIKFFCTAVSQDTSFLVRGAPLTSILSILSLKVIAKLWQISSPLVDWCEESAARRQWQGLNS